MQRHRRYLNRLYLERELDRLASFGNWPSSDRSPPPALLAKEGFFYLGDLDRTQCFFCSGVLQNWNRGDNVGALHDYHFPQCSIVRGIEHRNLGIQDVPLSERVQQYPCLFPYYSFMSNERDRLNSFDHRWPRSSPADPSLLSSAGFFYLGDKDRVRCFYCNGGIQDFEVGQDPWVEHAKGYPFCQFLLQSQGTRFVDQILSQYPHVNRPIMPRQRGGVLDRFVEPADTDRIEIVDPQERMQRLRQQVEDYMVRSDIVQLILQMGFSTALVAGVIRDRMIEQNSEPGSGSNTNDPYESAEKLLDDVQKREEEIKDET